MFISPSSGVVVVVAVVAFTSSPFFFRPTKKNSSPTNASAITPPIAMPAIAPVERETVPEEAGAEVEVAVEEGAEVEVEGPASPCQVSPGERE